MNRTECLEEAKKIITKDRNKQYGEPEDNFSSIAIYWTEYLYRKHNSDFTITDTDVAMMMSLFKIARMSSGNFKEDSFVDAIGYLACASELQASKSWDRVFSKMVERSKESENFLSKTLAEERERQRAKDTTGQWLKDLDMSNFDKK